jgi:hypothetical protein
MRDPSVGGWVEALRNGSASRAVRRAATGNGFEAAPARPRGFAASASRHEAASVHLFFTICVADGAIAQNCRA